MKNSTPIFHINLVDYAHPENEHTLSFGTSVHGKFFCEQKSNKWVSFCFGNYVDQKKNKAKIQEMYDFFLAGDLTESAMIALASAFASEVTIKKVIGRSKN